MCIKGEHECTCGWPGSVPTGLQTSIETQICVSNKVQVTRIHGSSTRDTQPISLYMKTRLIPHLLTHPTSVHTKSLMATNPNMSNDPIVVSESIMHWRTYSRLRTAPLSFTKPVHMIRHAFRLHSMWFHNCSESFPNRLFNISAHFLSVSSHQPLVDGLGMFWLSKYGVHAYIHLRACLIMTLWHPSTSIPCDYSLISYFPPLFIVFCIYCTHLLQKYKFPLHLTVENRSEQHLSSPLVFALFCTLAFTRI